MDDEQKRIIMQERLRQAIETGQVLKPAYHELKSLLFILIALGACALPADIAGVVWLLQHQWHGAS